MVKIVQEQISNPFQKIQYAISYDTEHAMARPQAFLALLFTATSTAILTIQRN